jgi:hypothetical protein
MIDGPQQLRWRKAFFDAFSEDEFSELLLYRLNDRVEKYASRSKPFDQIIGAVIDAYSRRGIEAKLIAAAVEARPANPEFLRLASTCGVVVFPDDNHLERLIKGTNSYLDLPGWLEKAGQMQVTVCRIEISTEEAESVYGTGFLVGPDLVMTNFHVIRCVVAAEDHDAAYNGPRAKAENVVCRFDYKIFPNGETNAGALVPLAKDWRVALSKTDELDFAVLRLASSAGEGAIGGNSDAPGARRGWIALPLLDSAPVLRPSTPVFIIQHPEGKPLKLALDTAGVISVDQAAGRVRYTTNTEPGSSGSPCFDQDWNLIAVHHSGDPNFAVHHRPEFNEGIIIRAIVADLGRQRVTI